MPIAISPHCLEFYRESILSRERFGVYYPLAVHSVTKYRMRHPQAIIPVFAVARNHPRCGGCLPKNSASLMMSDGQ